MLFVITLAHVWCYIFNWSKTLFGVRKSLERCRPIGGAGWLTSNQPYSTEIIWYLAQPSWFQWLFQLERCLFLHRAPLAKDIHVGLDMSCVVTQGAFSTVEPNKRTVSACFSSCACLILSDLIFLPWSSAPVRPFPRSSLFPTLLLALQPLVAWAILSSHLARRQLLRSRTWPVLTRSVTKSCLTSSADLISQHLM